MDYSEWFSKRLTELRLQKNVSARDMSLSLGQSESYTNKIENKRTLPSMAVFFYICEYFEITPQEFFNVGVNAPVAVKDLTKEFGKLTPYQAELLLCLVKDLKEH